MKPGGDKKRIATEELIAHSAAQFLIAAGKWLTGTEAFTAQLNPDLPSYGDYDQLMRLEEWYGRGDALATADVAGKGGAHVQDR